MKVRDLFENNADDQHYLKSVYQDVVTLSQGMKSYCYGAAYFWHLVNTENQDDVEDFFNSYIYPLLKSANFPDRYTEAYHTFQKSVRTLFLDMKRANFEPDIKEDWREDEYDKKPDPKQLTSLTGPSPQNIEKIFKVGSVIFDNVNGLGSTPSNQNVVYEGFAGFMTPGEYRTLASAADRSGTANELVAKIKEGYGIGVPFLIIEYNDLEYEDGATLIVKVRGHEGRGRADAVAIVNGQSMKMPVHFFLRGGGRARHLSEQFFKSLKNCGMIPQDGGAEAHVNLDPIFWMDKTL